MIAEFLTSSTNIITGGKEKQKEEERKGKEKAYYTANKLNYACIKFSIYRCNICF